MSLPLIALFVAAFAFGTTEFVIAGILPQVAEGLAVSIPQAGVLVSGYAIGIAIGGPLATIATARVPRRTLLIALALVFTAGQVACALAPGFGSMLAARVGVSVAHGVFFGVAMVVAVGLVKPQQRGFAVAIVLAGLTVSNIIGVPAGAAIGNLYGWRATFWAMFGLGAVATVAMLLLLPAATAGAAAAAGFGREVRVLARQQVWTSLIMMLLLMIGQYVPFTYIAPMLRDVTGLSAAAIPVVLLVNGVGATLGVFAGGRLAALPHYMRLMVGLMVVQSGVLAIFYGVSPHPWPAIAAVLVWGCLNFTIGTLIQTRILGWAADAPNLASSLIPAGFNFGIAIAASIGGLLIDGGYGYRSLPVLGIFAMLAAAGVAALSWAQELRSGVPSPAAAPH
ncbi:MAG: MFS transporter [Rhizobiales bacterium]|jgi:DHA1 family inner membrane transport protein|nr:MFS transporter [Hyphomicrobiales bacterium]